MRDLPGRVCLLAGAVLATQPSQRHAHRRHQRGLWNGHHDILGEDCCRRPLSVFMGNLLQSGTQEHKSRELRRKGGASRAYATRRALSRRCDGSCRSMLLAPSAAAPARLPRSACRRCLTSPRYSCLLRCPQRLCNNNDALGAPRPGRTCRRRRPFPFGHRVRRAGLVLMHFSIVL